MLKKRVDTGLLKPLILVLFPVVVVAGLALHKAWVDYKGNPVTYDTTDVARTAGRVQKSPCKTTPTIEYYYYELDKNTAVANNKFGLYIYAENKEFFKLAEELVNSSGGDWGYVLLPYNIEDRDSKKWRTAFEQLNERHLIPVIQLWATDLSNMEEDTRNAAEFLNSFLWPVRQRYISVYNEPNDAKFWFDHVDAAEYAKLLDFTIDTFKKQNPDYFMLNGALNASAPNNSQYIEETSYLWQMNTAVPGIFEKLDGWASHSYPQPNFSGNPYAYGNWSIRAYETELNFLRESLGVKKELPVFITETGWAHAEGENWNDSYLPVSEVAQNFKIAFEEIWLPDDRVVAVMPFTVRYDPPFDHFSWVNKDNVSYEHFAVVKSLEKVEGNPEVLHKTSTNVLNCP